MIIFNRLCFINIWYRVTNWTDPRLLIIISFNQGKDRFIIKDEKITSQPLLGSYHTSIQTRQIGPSENNWFLPPNLIITTVGERGTYTKCSQKIINLQFIKFNNLITVDWSKDMEVSFFYNMENNVKLILICIQSTKPI